MLANKVPSRTRLVLASSAKVIGESADYAGHSAATMCGEIVHNLSKKFSSVPVDMVARDTFETLDGNVASVRFDHSGGQIWAVRFTEPDSQTAGRQWTVELTVGTAGNDLLVGCRLSCFSRDYDFRFDPAVPNAWRKIVKAYPLSSYGFGLSDTAATVETLDDVNKLVSLIENPGRWRNVIVVSCDDKLNGLVGVDRVAQRMAGVAHVVRVTPGASFLLSERIGRDLSVFNLGVRTYRPSFSVDDDWARHPLWFRHQLSELTDASRQRIEAALCFDACRASIEQESLPASVPSFVDIKTTAAKSKLEHLAKETTLEDRLKAEQAHRSALEKQVEQTLEWATQEEEQRRLLEAERDNYRSQIFALHSRLEALERKLEPVSGFVEIGERPTTYDQVAAWVQANFAGKLALHPRAQRALKDGRYHDISAVCEALRLLAIDYRSVMLGESSKDVFDKSLADLGLSMSGSIIESRASEFGENYFISWLSKRLFLHGHVQKGNSREERYCLRIYFLWHPEESMIIVGWLPSHLPNQLT